MRSTQKSMNAAQPVSRSHTSRRMPYIRRAEAMSAQASSRLCDNVSFFTEEYFLHTLSREVKRAERTESYGMLMLIDVQETVSMVSGEYRLYRRIKRFLQQLSSCVRDIDCRGWYRSGRIIGIVCPGVTYAHAGTVIQKVRQACIEKFGMAFGNSLAIAWKMFPGVAAQDGTFMEEHIDQRVYIRNRRIDVYCDQFAHTKTRKRLLMVKRGIDIVGSACAVCVFSPLFLLIAAGIKLTSKGPVFFRQKRVGRSGKTFDMLKFRSMYTNNDTSIHREFVTKLIKNQIEGNENDPGAYKIKDDPRITAIGKIIRKTSLDELPQFINVLKGDMSLVGPRPPIPYEIENYRVWHTRRVLDMKPGITCFWQVQGRSTTTFETMVRMDINYFRTWSLWLDLKLLVLTPLSVIRARGAC